MRMPREAVLSHAGVRLVATKNDGDPTKGRVAFRATGDVGLILSEPRYANSKVHDFHRYAQVDLVGSFATGDDAQAAVPDAERYMRLNPGPDIELTEPVGETRQRRIVYALFIRLGPILTHWDPESRSVINETTPKHEMRNGFVIRQVARVERNLFVTTFGEGVNSTAPRAYLNGTLGPMPFHGMDVAINRKLAAAKAKGFLESGADGPPGSDTAYPAYEPAILYFP